MDPVTPIPEVKPSKIDLLMQVVTCLGWKKQHENSQGVNWVGPHGDIITQWAGEFPPFPNYPQDLDACALMRATLTHDEIEPFLIFLFCIVTDVKPPTDKHFPISAWMAYQVVNSSAEQQCQAFVAVRSR